MNPLRDHIVVVAAAVKHRDEQAYREMAAQVEQAQIPTVAASITFAFLHATLSASATALFREKLPVACVPYDAVVTLRYSPRAASCRCTLHNGVIEVMCQINDQPVSVRTFVVPATMDQATLVGVANDIAKQVINYVMGLDG